MQNWIDVHPWMVFVLGMMSMLSLNSLFVSLGGGYKKYPTCSCQVKEKEDDRPE